MRMASGSGGGWQRQMGGAEQLGPRWHLKQVVASGVPILIFSGLMYKQRLDIRAEVAARNEQRAQRRAQEGQDRAIVGEAAQAAVADVHAQDDVQPREDEWRVAMSHRMAKLETLVKAKPATTSTQGTTNGAHASLEGRETAAVPTEGVVAGGKCAETGQSVPPLPPASGRTGGTVRRSVANNEGKDTATVQQDAQ